jgi:hypothetical protein
MALPKLDVPRYEMKVPSTGKKVVYRPYLVKEEKILMLAMESNDQQQMIRGLKDVVTSCTEGTVDVDSLAMFDLEYIFMQLRGKSVGEKTEVGIKCKSCEEVNTIEVNLSKVVVDVPKEAARKIKLTESVGMIMTYPTVNDLMDIQLSEEKDINKVFDLILMCISSIYTNEEIFDAKSQTNQELKDFIESLSSEQFNKVKDFVENMPSASIGVEFDCTNCKEHNKLEVKGLANFFK